MFAAFLPAVSKDALKRMSEDLRSWRIHTRTATELEDIASWVNPVVRGWMAYYGKFYRTEPNSLLRRINAYLVRWARRKYKRLTDIQESPRSRPRSGVNKTTGVGSPSRATNSSKEGPTPVPVRVSPTDRIRRHIDELFAEDRPLPEILEEVARLGAQLLMQAALEAEVTEFLGRDRYARAAVAEDARPGSRNGYRDVTVKTTAGPVTLARPKLRGTSEAFASRLFGSARHQDQRPRIAGHRIVHPGPVGPGRGGHLGRRARRPGRHLQVHRLHRVPAIKDEYQAWAGRRLDEITLDYLFLDASFFRMHPGSPAEPVLAAWGITTEGKPAFIGLAPRHRRVRRRLEGLPCRPERPRPGQPAAGHQRRRPGPDRRDRAGLPQGAQAKLSCSPSAGTFSPRSRPGCRPRSRTPTGRSSTPRT